MTIDYLLIGNITKDLIPGGSTPGGTALYSALTAQRLGMRVGLVTCVPDADFVRKLLPGVELHVLPAEQRSTFENRYWGNDRLQIIHHVAPAVMVEDVPVAWRQAPIVHLGPIALEADHGLIGAFPNSTVCATPQGWMRKWDAEGIVSYAPLDNVKSLFAPLDILVFSAEDVNYDSDAINELIESVPVAVVTEARDGAIVYTKEGHRSIPGRPANVVDPTGAGDVFATAYFVRFAQSRDPYESAAFANVVASLSIEHQAAKGIPTYAEAAAWLAAHREK